MLKVEEDDEQENEDDYDALNEETFGDATNGDWEGMHENFVRLNQNHKKDSSSKIESSKNNNYEHDSDLGKLVLIL